MRFNPISPSAFSKLNQPAVIDVRTPGEVANLQLHGTSNIPLQEITADKIHALYPDQETTIYLLCGTEKRAQIAAEKIAADVQRPLAIIEGGIKALQQAGVPLIQQAGGVISIERQVRITAGLLVLVGVIAGSLVNPAFYGLAGFVGAGLTFAGITDTCAMGLLLARMPWNQTVR